MAAVFEGYLIYPVMDTMTHDCMSPHFGESGKIFSLVRMIAVSF